MPARPTIVVVDDEKFIAITYRESLKEAGYHVILAYDGKEALQKITAAKPDMVLLDLLMPEMSGIDVLRRLKKDPKLKKIPVIILTNLSLETDEQEARSLGASDFIVKSNISLKELIDKIKLYVQPAKR